MGLLLELIDEVLPIRPKGKSTLTNIDIENGLRTEVWTMRHALPNAIFQFIDCIIIPFYTIQWTIGLLNHFTFGNFLLALLGAFSSVFSIFQFLNYLLKPVETYLSVRDKLIGETAIGSLLSALLNIQFKTKYP